MTNTNNNFKWGDNQCPVCDKQLDYVSNHDWNCDGWWTNRVICDCGFDCYVVTNPNHPDYPGWVKYPR